MKLLNYVCHFVVCFTLYNIYYSMIVVYIHSLFSCMYHLKSNSSAYSPPNL